ncbi:nucleotidyl transferase AbiEii/AbiGii toxin family protein [Chryseobacterium caseinilyticum]|uniref:Nucleotidyl transferase AbiEii/AbiGii toxin family protein n=1 Tax=Chryseobacterium caseinilyticum TaxID=2771428 RepID=A0ABR8Z6Q1_9FLAO|nr:nucleotidyl transferase AbiEii/AbiGii toxin family protein [Chryseobacterium caseinilyticum]MBD8080972.1 nucleotidyl transferase AbiEii/AbiGii toxin family protein [Chryseobacterium caseinilyticum]
MLYYSTISTELRSALEIVMDADILKPFRLVGGTSLSLQLGHRISIDIDLFTEATYGSLNFEHIETYLKSEFPHISFSSDITSFGKSYFVGKDPENAVKLDIFYSDPFIEDELLVNKIRLAGLKDISAMKIEVVQNGGRKKDFWDLHELLNHFSIDQMLEFHKNRYPYNHDYDLIIKNFTNFEIADEDFDVLCLKGKHWEIIKTDFENIVKNFTDTQ